jgi:hypothetical protein
VATYDTEGDNSERVAELLQDAQDLGQLPADLIKDLAPGLEFGNDGLPVSPHTIQADLPAVTIATLPKPPSPKLALL